jgi:hypothetical protein
MLDSDAPTKISIPWARDGARNTIPNTTSSTLGAASYPTGFPGETMIPLDAGGKAPDGKDFNGIFNALSAWARWHAAGAPVYYDATFSTAIGGYPKDASVVATDHSGWWISTVDGNTTNPDSGGAGWRKVMFIGSFARSNTYTSAATFTVPAGVTIVRATVVGGGGGGASCIANGGNYVSGGGGGAGGMAIGLYTVTPAATVAVTVGAGGSAGFPGGTSSFGAFCSATGGASSVFPGVHSSPGGAPGGASGGTILNANGGWGSDGQAASTYFAGNGAPGPFGGGGRAGELGGIAGYGYGAGGGGAYDFFDTNVTRTGGAGAGGVVIVEY